MVKPTEKLTITGKMIDLADPDLNDFDILDIAHALSNLCRFTGHVKQFYSVAEHSIIVAKYLYNYGPEMQLAGLLHDASEAYLGDVSSPLKSMLTEYKKLEEVFQFRLKVAFDVRVGFDAALIKEADRFALCWEARDLTEGFIPNPPELPKAKLQPMEQDVAYLAFLQMFEELTGERVIADRVMN